MLYDKDMLVSAVKEIQSARKALLFIMDGLDEAAKDSQSYREMLGDVDDRLFSDAEGQLMRYIKNETRQVTKPTASKDEKKL